MGDPRSSFGKRSSPEKRTGVSRSERAQSEDLLEKTSDISHRSREK